MLLLPRHCTAIEKNTLELDTPWTKCLQEKSMIDEPSKDKDARLNRVAYYRL